MKLEEEIKQEKFRNEYHKLAVNIFYTNNWLMNIQEKYFAENDITAQQFNILRILRGQNKKPASINLLKERMLDKMCDASRLVERLRIKGLVERTISSNDRRKADVVITENGMKLLNCLDQLVDEVDKILSRLSTDEAKTINVLLDKLRG